MALTRSMSMVLSQRKVGILARAVFAPHAALRLRVCPPLAYTDGAGFVRKS
jgi:hypothetical protein